MTNLKTVATLTCLKCQAIQTAKMPEDARQHFYKCQKCGEMLSPKPSDCCVFCSYADVKCPSRQEEQRKQWGPHSGDKGGCFKPIFVGRMDLGGDYL